MFIPKGSTVKIIGTNVVGNKELIGFYECDKDTDVYEKEYISIGCSRQISSIEKMDNNIYILYTRLLNYRYFLKKKSK